MSNPENLRLREKDVSPTKEVLQATFGKSYNAYGKFQEELANLEIKQEWQYYLGGSKAWMARGQYRWTTPRGTNKEKTLYWLSGWDGYFKVAVWFLDKNRMEVLKADVSEETKKLIRGTANFATKMATFPVEIDVCTPEQLLDIYELIKYKKKLEAL